MSASDFARRFVSVAGVSSGRVASRAVLATLFFFMLTVAADAYTLVLRSGRHVNVPDNFRVTRAAVIYETSPGFTVTVWLSNVDIAATERANGEPAGSFAAKVRRQSNVVAAAPAAQTTKALHPDGRRVITNKELEPLRLRREAQEQEYERTRRERGMPSKQELQERIEEQDRELRETARRLEEEMREAELAALRSELANVRQQLGNLSLQLSQPPPGYVTPSFYPYFYGTPVQIINDLSFGRQGHFGRVGFGLRPHFRQGPFRRPHGHFTPIYVSPRRNAGSPSVVRTPGHRR